MMFHLLAMGVALQAILVESGEWTRIPWDGNGPRKRLGQVACLVPSLDVIFVWGGEEEVGEWDSKSYPDDTSLFSLNGMNWSEGSEDGRPRGRRLALAAVPGDRKEVWVMGGQYLSTSYPDDLWRYDLDSKTWTEYSWVNWDNQLDSPNDRWHISHQRMLWTGEEMWLYQGDSDIWSFRLPEDKETTSIVWTKKAWTGAQKTYRYSFVAVWASARREMYVHGGRRSEYTILGDLWKYSDNSKLWEQINFDGGPQARTYHVGVWREEKEELFIQGGTTRYEVLSDLWKYSVPDNTWTLLSESAPARRAASVGVWLPKTQEIWLHGGYCVPERWDCTDVWRFALMDNCGAFSCAAGTVRKDHAEDIGSFGQSECCNNITATTTSTYTTATTTFVTITTSTVSRTTVTGTTVTGTTMTVTSTVTSTATEQWEEENAANALGGKKLRLELIAAVVAIITSHI